MEGGAGTVTTITDAGIEAAVRLGDVIDPAVQRERLEKRLRELDEDIARAERKLSNPAFVEKAPTAVVDKERAKLEEASDNREKLTSRLSALA